MSLRSEVIRIFNELVAAGKKISQLPAANTPLSGDELLEISQNGVSSKISASNLSSGGTGVQSIVAGTNVTVDNTDPQNPIVSASGGGGSGTVESVTGDGVDNTDPANPVLSFPTPGDIGAEVAGAAATVQSNLSAHIADTTDAHAASAITNTPTGNISATTVQAAINELDSEKQSALGFTPENVANKATNLTSPDNTKYPTTQAVATALASITVADASETVKGIIEIATQAETNTGTDDLRAITPLKAATKFANKLETINTQTGNYVLVLTDADIKTVVMNVASSSNTVTIPPNSSVAFPVGTIITIAQQGTGLTSMVAGAGVTIRSSTGGLSSQGQYSPMVIEKIATDEWFLWNGPAPLVGTALTRTNDTNVTATLSGSPSTALLAAVEIALGWTGQLAVTRGGTGLSASANGDVVIGTGSNTMGVVNALATTRTAYWHLKAGTATASTAPLKFTSGTNLTTAEAGAVEYDGTVFYMSPSASNRYRIMIGLTGSVTQDVGSIAAQTTASPATITVTGASVGDPVYVGVSAMTAGTIFTAQVTATNTVTVYITNPTSGAIDPPNATYSVRVIKTP